ncbi:hypothetical protein Tco_0278593 [Tanacetum coccineum]
MYIMTPRSRTRVFRPGPVWGCDRLVSKAKVIENQVMAAPIISISSDTSKESVADLIVTPKVGAVSVVSPAGVLDLVDYSSSSDFDPSEDSLPPTPDLPLVLPFLCSDDMEADGESEPAEQRPVPSSHDTLAPLLEFPLAPVVAPPGVHRHSFIDHLLGLHDVVRLLDVGGHLARDVGLLLLWRFRDLYLSNDSEKEHMEVAPANAEAVADVGISDQVVAHPEDSIDPLAIGDNSESSRGGIPDFEDTIYDIVHYMSEEFETGVPKGSSYVKYRERSIDSICWHMALSQEEFRQVCRDRDDARRRLKRTMTITRSGMTPEAIEELVNRRVEEALAAHEATCAANALETENQSQNDSDGGNGNAVMEMAIMEMVRMEMVEMEI